MRGGYVEALGVDETVSRDEAQRVLRRLWRLLRPQRGSVLLGAFLLVLQTATVLAGPAIFRAGVDRGIVPGDARLLTVFALAFLGVAIAGAVLTRLVLLVIGRTGEHFLREFRERAFRHLMGLGIDYYERHKTGKLVSRLTSDIDALQELVATGLVMFVQNGLLFVGAIVVIFVMSWELALFTITLIPVVVVASIWFRNKSNVAYLAVRDSIATNLARLQEGLAGVRVVQAYAQEDTYTLRFRATNEAQYAANMKTVGIAVRYFPVVEYAGVAGTALILGVGGWLTAEEVVTVGTVAAFVLYLSNLFEPIQQLSQLYSVLQQAIAALKKVFDLLDATTSVPERPGAVDLPEHGPVEIDRVSFRYGDGPLVLHDVSLRAESGERIALVGPTGAGKSTLAKLVVRLYDPVEGTVRFGGLDLRDATAASLRRRIVLVPQEGFLFAGTIRENIRMGRGDATDADVEAAVDALGLSERFSAFPDGLDAAVAERGSRLSAGERQLVSIARAALADPAVLVLDEATSNLDPGTELALEAALERLVEGRTVFVVAHRLTTAARADRVAVIDDGRLAELGSHAELLARNGRYAALYASWVSGQGQRSA